MPVMPLDKICTLFDPELYHCINKIILSYIKYHVMEILLKRVAAVVR